MKTRIEKRNFRLSAGCLSVVHDCSRLFCGSSRLFCISSRLPAIALVMLWAVAVVVAGCSNDIETLPTVEGEVPLQITDGAISAEVQTRATLSSGSIGIFRTTTNNYSALYNVQYTYSGGWKAASSGNAIYLSQLPANLCAYYPYGSVTFTSGTSTVATLSAQKYDSTKDMCYATTGGVAVCNKTPNATFAMTRAYSRLTLTIKRHASNYVGTGGVSTINLKNGSSFYNSRTLNISNGNYANPTGSPTTGGYSYSFGTTIAAGKSATADLLIPPQSVANGLTITLTIDGTARSVTVPADKFTNKNLAAGIRYGITLEISAAQIIPDGTITGDEYDGQSSGGDYELNIYAVTVDEYGTQDNANFEVNAKN